MLPPWRGYQVVHAARGPTNGGDIVQIIKEPHFDIRIMAAATARAAAGDWPSNIQPLLGRHTPS